MSLQRCAYAKQAAPVLAKEQPTSKDPRPRDIAKPTEKTEPLPPGVPKVIAQPPSKLFFTNLMVPMPRTPTQLTSASYPPFSAHLKRVDDVEASLTPNFIPLPASKDTHTASARRRINGGEKAIRILLIESKKRVPGGAVQRNRAVRRAFEAFRTCIQRKGMGRWLMDDQDRLLVVCPNELAKTCDMDQMVEYAQKSLARLTPGAHQTSRGGPQRGKSSVRSQRSQRPNRPHKPDSKQPRRRPTSPTDD